MKALVSRGEDIIVQIKNVTRASCKSLLCYNMLQGSTRIILLSVASARKCSYSKRLWMHISNVNMQRKKLCTSTCAKCGKGFYNKMHYQIHADRHNDMKHYSCGKCDYRCYSTLQLNLHVTNCIDGINHECSVCGKEFMQK